MTLPVWPITSKARDGWSMPSPWQAPLSTQMEGNNQRTRQMPGANIATVTYPLVPISADDWETLDIWFRDTLGFGVSRWTMDVWTGRAYVNRVVQFDGGAPPTYSPSAEPGMVDVVLKLRILGVR